MDDFALATLAARADEAGGPPPTKFYEPRDNLHGVFHDHPGRVELDLGKTDASRVTVEAGDDRSVYAIAGPAPADVLARYPAGTGRRPMPPLWALGHQPARWSYRDAG